MFPSIILFPNTDSNYLCGSSEKSRVVDEAQLHANFRTGDLVFLSCDQPHTGYKSITSCDNAMCQWIKNTLQCLIITGHLTATAQDCSHTHLSRTHFAHIYTYLSEWTLFAMCFFLLPNFSRKERRIHRRVECFNCCCVILYISVISERYSKIQNHNSALF